MGTKRVYLQLHQQPDREAVQGSLRFQVSGEGCEMKQNDGGAAFPSAVLFDQVIVDSPGMSLRDWFAGMALQGIMANPEKIDLDDPNKIEVILPLMAYALAESMLIAREHDTP
jgi:hypothetical protein